MAEPAMIVVPWLAEFERDPAEAVDELLRGVADVAPYERAGAADVLATLFGGLAEDNPDRRALDEALGDWLFARRGDGPKVRREHGMNRYVEELIQALTAVYRLRLTGTAERLRASFASFHGWLKSLALGPGQDPALELWQIMALMQHDRRFLGDWYRLCEEAGHSLPEAYLTVGLLGLRRIPGYEGEEVEPGGSLRPEVIAGLFRWAARLPQGPASRKIFQRRFGALRVLYPRSPQRWRDIILPLLEAYPGAPFHEWLEDASMKLGRGGHRSNAVATVPSRSRFGDLLRRLGKEPTSRLVNEIRALVQGYEGYAEATGDPELLVKVACDFSGRLRRRAPGEALRLARLANRWQPNNHYTWTHWAAALEVLGKEDRAEVVYWEAVRRFPDNPVARVALADLLVRVDRSEEAEGLLREAVDRFPDNAHSHVALAELLARAKRFEEAEALLRKSADRVRDDAHCRVFLAEVLARTNRLDEAEALLRKAGEDFPDDLVARNTLASLLARTERPNEAEHLYRETMIRFRRDRVAPQALAFWLLRWNRVVEAEALYWKIRARFPEDRYTRKLADEIARHQGGWRGESEVPDFAVWRLAPETLEEEPVSGSFVASENDEEKEPSLESEEKAGDDTWEVPLRYAEGSSVPGVVAEPEAFYDAPGPAEFPLEIELDPRLICNAEVSCADFRLRSGENGSVRRKALSDIERILDTDPDYVYPRLVLGLHEAIWRQRLMKEVEAFHNAYPLRFLAARESGMDEQWDRLLSDFGNHYPWTLLGRLVAGKGDADPVHAVRLATWVEEGNGSRQGFEAFTAKRLEQWLGDSPHDSKPAELLRRIVAHRTEVEVLIEDALRWAVNEG